MKYITIILLPLLILTGSGCTRRMYVPLERVSIRADTVRMQHYQADTLVYRDSVVIIQRGDTVINHHWHTRDRIVTRAGNREHISTDTVVREVPVEIEHRVEVEVEKPLPFLKRAALRLGYVAAILLFISLIYIIIKYRRR